MAVLFRAAPVVWHRFSPERTSTADSATYLNLATNLADGRGFGRSPEVASSSVENPSTVEIFRTPGYPLFLALLLRLHLPVQGATIASQIALDALAVLLSFLAACRFLPLRWALVAGAVQAVDVPRAVYANLMMSDTLFTFLLALTLWLLAGADREAGARRAMAGGAAIGLAAAVRPLGVVMVVPGVLALAARRVRASVLAVFAGAALVWPAAWIVRNGVRTGEWALSTAFDYNLCLVAAAKVEARAAGIPRVQAERALVEAAARSSPGTDLRARAAAFRRLGFATLREHPTQVVRELAVSALEMTLAGERRNLLRLFGASSGSDAVPALGETARSAGGAADALGRMPVLEKAVVLGQVAWNALVWAACAAGVWGLARRARLAELALYALGVAAILVPSLVVATGRMRLPASPMLASLAGAGGWWVVAGRAAPDSGVTAGGRPRRGARRG